MNGTGFLEIAAGPTDPLDAAAVFHEDTLPQVRAMLANGLDSLVLRFPHAEDKPHRWRREAVAALAREAAPTRVNAVAPASGEADEGSMAATVAFLHTNGGVTGQLLLAGTLGGG